MLTRVERYVIPWQDQTDAFASKFMCLLYWFMPKQRGELEGETQHVNYQY